jgi:hypothetical protein
MQVFDWVNYVNTPQSQKELDKIRNSVNRQAPIGCKNWVIKIRKTQTHMHIASVNDVINSDLGFFFRCGRHRGFLIKNGGYAI